MSITDAEAKLLDDRSRARGLEPIVMAGAGSREADKPYRWPDGYSPEEQQAMALAGKRRRAGQANPENDYQRAIIDLAHANSWVVAHFRKARTKNGWATPVAADGKGWPDLLLCHPSGAVAAWEVKAKGGRPTPEQKGWLAILNACGIPARCVWPKDWTWICFALRDPQRITERS